MTDLIPGKLYVVTTWAMEENRKNLAKSDVCEKWEEDLRAWSIEKTKYVYLKPCDVVMFLGPFGGPHVGHSEFLYKDCVCVVANARCLREPRLVLATPETVKGYKRRLNRILYGEQR